MPRLNNKLKLSPRRKFGRVSKSLRDLGTKFQIIILTENLFLSQPGFAYSVQNTTQANNIKVKTDHPTTDTQSADLEAAGTSSNHIMNDKKHNETIVKQVGSHKGMGGLAEKSASNVLLSESDDIFVPKRKKLFVY